MQTSTTTSRLERAFDPKRFRRVGHELIDLLADHLDAMQDGRSEKVIPYRTPAEELSFWQQDFRQQSSPGDFFRKVLEHSIDVHHPRCIGHQVSAPAFIGGLAGLLSDILNNGTGVYEMGMASNALERVLTEFVAQNIGYDESAAGFLTSGGTLANLTALLAARKAKAGTAVWEEGHSERLAVMVSEEAHYCVDRAARILGMGSDGIIKVPVDDHFRIRIDLLEQYKQQAERKGLKVISIIGCAGSTATGSYDDLSAMAEFSRTHNLWFHIDGAHGGGVIFSERYQHLAQGIQEADTVVIDFHKTLLTPALNTALIFKNGTDSYKTFEQRAQYLWDAQREPEWYHSGKRTFECTKLMLSIKVYAILTTYGPEIFGENIDRLYGLATSFADLIRNREDFELLIEPEGNIVNYRYVNAPLEKLDELNSKVRQHLMESGQFYIVQTLFDGQRYLRSAIMNPLTRESDLQALLDTIAQTAQLILQPSLTS